MKLNRFIIFLFILLPGLLYAADATTSALSFRPPESDVSVKFLGYIFGLVDGVLYGTGSQIMGKIFGVFNSAVLALGGIILMYTLLVSTVNTAHEGEMLGRKWSSMWIPIRSVAAVALLLPKKSGYCIIQIFVMWVVIQGVGAADKVWNVALDYLQQGGVIVQPSLGLGPSTGADSPSYAETVRGGAIGMPDVSVGRRPATEQPRPKSYQEKVTAAGDMLKSLVCLAATQHVLEDVREAATDAKAEPQPPSVPDFIGSVNLSDAKSIGGSLRIQLPNFPPTSHYAPLNGMCGSIVWKELSADNLTSIAKNLNITDAAAKEMGLVRTIAVQQMYLDLANTAQTIVRNFFAEKENQLTFGHLDAPSNWVRDDTTPALLTGYELVNAADVYIAIMRPTLSAIKEKVEGLDFIGQSKKEGWIMAGSYFFNLATINAKGIALASDQGTLTANAPPDITITADKQQLNVNTSPNIVYPKVSLPYVDLTDLEDIVSTSSVFFTNFGKYLSDANIINRSPQPLKVPQIGKLFDIPIKGFDVEKPPKCQKKGVPLGKRIICRLTNAGIKTLNAIKISLNFIAGNVVRGSLEFIAGAWQLFADVLLASLNSTGHPILDAAKLGKVFIEIAGWSFVAAILIIIIGTLASLGTLLGAFLLLSPFIFVLLTMLFVYGVLLAYYVPLIPYIIFLFAALGWFVAVIESMVAAPIVALGMAHPEGHEVYGKAEPAVMLLTNVFLRPSMMIIGYIAAIMLSYVGIYFLNYSFNQGIQPLVAPLGSGGVYAGWAVYLAPFAIIAVYVYLFLAIIQKSFDLIHMLPDKIMRWLSGGMQESLGADFGKGVADQIRGGLKSGAQQAGQQAAAGLKSLGEKAKGNMEAPEATSATAEEGGGGGDGGGGSGSASPAGGGGGPPPGVTPVG